jgi:membrane-bound serine protease (ClpP class)
MPDLLAKMDGMEVKKRGKMIKLETKGGLIKKYESGWRLEFLDILADPYIAYLLMMAGMLGIMMEIYNPGTIFPGVIGVICLLLAMFAFQQLPVNYVGVLLLAFGIVLFVLEVKIISFGLLTVGGIICLTVGSIMLFDTGTGESAVRLSLSFVLPTVAVFSAFFIFAMSLALKAWKAKPRTGDSGLIGEEGVAVTDIDNEGRAYLHGEYWNARSDSHIPKGERVRVIGVENLRINVTRA